jgi:hypothetical protein
LHEDANPAGQRFRIEHAAMMNDRCASRQAACARAGLCARCAHVRIVPGAKGAEFYLCERSFTDPRFRRYPAIPVVACVGFRPAGEEPPGG